MNNHKYLEKGFTLVEMIIVILVISILAAIVLLNYDAYQDRADQSQISTTVDAYAKTLKSYAIENNSYPKNTTCLPKNSKCCITSIDAGTTIYCLKTTEYSGYNWGTSADDGIAKYVNNTPPLMPVVQDWGDCQSGLMTWGPCKPTSSIPSLGVTYIANQTGSNYTSTDTSVTGRGFLIYFVDPKFSCGTDKVMTVSGTDLVFNSSAKYTWQTSDFNECIVGLKD